MDIAERVTMNTAHQLEAMQQFKHVNKNKKELVGRLPKTKPCLLTTYCLV